MKIIVDVNVILSALIKNSITRKIILNSGLVLYFPEPSLHKIRKYQNYVIKKSGMHEDEYHEILRGLFEYVRIIPTEEIQKNWTRAKAIMEHIDPEDVVFIASAMTFNSSIIWSDDKDFEKQKSVKIIKTHRIGLSCFYRYSFTGITKDLSE